MKTYLEPEEIDKLEDAADSLRDKLLIRVSYYLAGRISELLPMAVDDIDFRRGTVIIKQLKKRIKLSCSHCKPRLSKSHKY